MTPFTRTEFLPSDNDGHPEVREQLGKILRAMNPGQLTPEHPVVVVSQDTQENNALYGELVAAVNALREPVPQVFCATPGAEPEDPAQLFQMHVGAGRGHSTNPDELKDAIIAPAVQRSVQQSLGSAIVFLAPGTYNPR